MASASTTRFAGTVLILVGSAVSTGVDKLLYDSFAHQNLERSGDFLWSILFPTEAYLPQYESRRDDPDVQASPQLAALIDEYVEWYATEVEKQQMTIRGYYLAVSVSPAEVHFERESLLHSFAVTPLAGALFRAWLAPSPESQCEAMFTTLSERLRLVETGLREIDDCEAYQVDVGNATRIIAEFWAGQPQAYDDMEQLLRTSLVVGED